MVPCSDLPSGAPFASSRKCILVVEDELLIRMIVSDELREAGYEVIEAFDADEALAVLNSLVRIDLIFSDVRMPGALDGLGLLAIVKATFPKMPVIMASGHVEPELAMASGANKFLAKPYLLERLLVSVQEELDKAE